MKHELLLILVIVLLLVMKISGLYDANETLINYFNILLFINCCAGWVGNYSGTLFDNQFVNNNVIAFEKNILNAGTLIICLYSSGWLKKQIHLAEFYILLLSSLAGMFFMISSRNLMMFYLSVELSAIPVAALCNFNQSERRSSEAAMKMIFSSAFSSCIMLLGIALIYGAGGTLDFQNIALIPSTDLLLTGSVLFITGVLFKLSVVPFHLWTADVYEGSPVAITSFLSVISKASVVFVLPHLLIYLFPQFHDQWYLLLCVLAVATLITGNLFAIRQENLKRFLAFSSVTQAGFILIGLTGNDPFTSSIYFILVYLFSNLAALAIVSRITDLTGRETISDYRGLAETNPALAWTMAIALFSLAGIPPTAGFFGKIFLLTSGASSGNYLLITIAALNMMVSLYYYLRVIRAMFMEKNDNPLPAIPVNNLYKLAVGFCLLGIIATGFCGSLYRWVSLLSD